MVQKEESDPPDRSEYLLRQRCQNLGSLHANPSEIFPKQFWFFFCQKKNPKSINTLTPNFNTKPKVQKIANFDFFYFLKILGGIKLPKNHEFS